MTLRTIVRILSTSATALAALLMLQTASAVGDGLAKNLNAQPLVTALEVFAADTGLQLVYRAEIASGLQSKGARAGLSAEETLQELLRETGLTFEFLNDRTVAIRLASGTSGASSSERDGRTQNNLTPYGTTDGAAASKSWFDRFRLAQAETSSANSQKVKEQREPESQDLPRPEESTKGIPEVLVEGSKVLNMDIRRTRDDPQPYVVFERSTIARSGAVNLEDFLKQRLTMHTQSRSLSQTPGDVRGNVSQINLRGLGTNQTLILVDGRRFAGGYDRGAPTQADLNGIPLAAVERIEVLPTTASGIHGGSATGGVINIIMRRDYSGIELKTTYENSFESDAAARRVDVSGGFNLQNGKTNVLLTGSYSDANPLAIRERDLIQRGRQRILANNPAAFFGPNVNPPLGETTNIRSNAPLVNGVRPNLTFKGSNASIGSPHTFVPYGYAGTGSDGGAGLIANAGRYNFDLAQSVQPSSGAGDAPLLSSPRVRSLTATVRREWSSRLQTFLEASASDTNAHVSQTSAAPTFNLAATSPANPFNEPITVTVPIPTLRDETVTETKARRLAAGVIFKLPKDWLGGADYTWNNSTSSFVFADTLSGSAATAVSNGTINVLRDTNVYPVDFSLHSAPVGYSIEPYRATTKDIALRLAGPLGSLPAGSAVLSGLLEYQEVDFDQASAFNTAGGSIFPSRSQSIGSAYLELRVPLVAAANAIPAVKELELQISARYDDYTARGVTSTIFTTSPTPIVRNTNKIDSTNPTVALRYQPIESLTLRASFGTGFLPPAVNQLAPTTTPILTGSETDPLRGNTPVGTYSRITGGNPGLQPEKSEAWSAGAILTPRFIEGLRLSVDYSKIDKTDNIGGFPGGSQGLINSEALFSSRITRAAPTASDLAQGWAGQILVIDQSLFNIASTEVEAYDVQLDYHLESADRGAFDFFALATWQTHYLTQVLTGQPFVENVGITSGNPLKLRANAGITWSHGAWTLGWGSRYFDSYRHRATDTNTILSQGGERIPSQIYHDLFTTYRWDRESSGKVPLSNLEIQLGIKNVFNTPPPFDASFFYSYSAFGDPRLATYFVSLKSNF